MALLEVTLLFLLLCFYHSFTDFFMMLVIPDYQSAYRQFYSCETALLKVFDDLLWSMEHQRITALVAVDLSAAFDTVDHTIWNIWSGLAVVQLVLTSEKLCGESGTSVFK